MGIAATIVGCLAVISYMVSLTPGLRGFQWSTVTLGAIGAVLGIVGIGIESYVVLSVVGLILSVIAGFFGYVSLTSGARPSRRLGPTA